MLPVAIPLTSRFNNLFTLQERVVLKGVCGPNEDSFPLYYVAVAAF